MEKKSNAKKIIIGVVVLVVVAVLMFVLYKTFMPKGQAGEKEIKVIVTHADGTEKEFTYNTEAEYLGEVITAEGLVEGDQGEYGLYITTVDGETADESKQEWWCLTKDGEALNTPADQTAISDGEAYGIELREGY